MSSKRYKYRLATKSHAPVTLPPFVPPGVLDYGSWESFTWDNRGQAQHGLRLTVTQAPWRGLFAALDEHGRDLSAAPVESCDEADAIVAACWRYGSCANVWASGEPYAVFKKAGEFSRFSDDEMRRVAQSPVFVEKARTTDHREKR